MDVFLGVVERDGNIYIPWRGTHVTVEHNYEIGDNLLVTLDTTGNLSDKVIKVELPTLDQLKKIRDELANDWERFTDIFTQFPMWKKVEMLRSLDNSIRLLNTRI